MTAPVPVSGADGAEVYAKLAELGLTLPEVVPPLAAYVPAVQSGNYVQIDSHVKYSTLRSPSKRTWGRTASCCWRTTVV